VTVTDPCLLARRVDSVVLVIAHGVTTARLIRRAREVFEGVGAKVHGAVINNAAARQGFYGESYYGYGYRYESSRAGSEGRSPGAGGKG
jgi:Mrp family chromosome partitioning ATPase